MCFQQIWSMNHLVNRSCPISSHVTTRLTHARLKDTIEKKQTTGMKKVKTWDSRESSRMKVTGWVPSKSQTMLENSNIRQLCITRIRWRIRVCFSPSATALGKALNPATLCVLKKTNQNRAFNKICQRFTTGSRVRTHCRKIGSRCRRRELSIEARWLIGSQTSKESRWSPNAKSSLIVSEPGFHPLSE